MAGAASKGDRRTDLDLSPRRSTSRRQRSRRRSLPFSRRRKASDWFGDQALASDHAGADECLSRVAIALIAEIGAGAWCCFAYASCAVGNAGCRRLLLAGRLSPLPAWEVLCGSRQTVLPGKTRGATISGYGTVRATRSRRSVRSFAGACSAESRRGQSKRGGPASRPVVGPVRLAKLALAVDAVGS